ncbi:hypothetical protein WJ970_06620 [Achromobacter xylosoxidans]
MMAMLFTAATVISVFYYATFARSIDVFVFGLIDEDTSSVLGTVWQGYPVLRAGLLLSHCAGGHMVADREMARAAGAGLAKTALGPRLRAAAAADHRHHGAGLPWLDQQVPLEQGRHQSVRGRAAQRHRAQRHLGLFLGPGRPR